MRLSTSAGDSVPDCTVNALREQLSGQLLTADDDDGCARRDRRVDCATDLGEGTEEPSRHPRRRDDETTSRRGTPVSME
jgi:hypothetical protein